MKRVPVIALDPVRDDVQSAYDYFEQRVSDGGDRFRSLLDHIEAGDGLDVFLEDFPTVTREQALGFWEQASATFLASVKSRPIDLQERFQCEDIAWVVAEAKPGHK